MKYEHKLFLSVSGVIVLILTVMVIVMIFRTNYTYQLYRHVTDPSFVYDLKAIQKENQKENFVSKKHIYLQELDGSDPNWMEKVDISMPVHIKKPKEFEHLTNIDMDNLLEKYHDYILQDFSENDDKKIINVPFQQYIKEKNVKRYIKLFTDPYDILVKQKDIDLFMKATKSKYSYKNFLIGANYGKTKMHCHISRTNYIMLKGRKKWILFDPSESSKLIPVCRSRTTNIFYDSMVDIFNIDHEKFPDVKNAKRIEVIMEEGDILIFPEMWWHSVENLDEFTIGCDMPHISIIDSFKQNFDLTLFTVLNYNLVKGHLSGKDINEIVFSKVDGYVDNSVKK